MRLTPAQLAAVRAPPGDALVSASAGSGKTSVLSHRVLYLITDATPRASLDRMLIVTFTRAAAAELRERVAGLLAERLQSLRNDDDSERELRCVLLAQESLLDSAEIGTIDSWCYRVLRENFAAAGVDPAIRVLPPADAAILRNAELKSLNDWLHIDADPLAVEARRWIDAMPRPREEPLRDWIEQLSRFREQLANPSAWTESVLDSTRGDDDTIRGRAQSSLRDALRSELQRQFDGLAGRAALRDYRTQLSDWLDRLLSDESIADLCNAIASTAPRQVRAADPADQPLVDRLFERRLRKAFHPAEIERAIEFAPGSARRLATLVALTDRYDAALRRAKERRCAWEFADILQFTFRLLTQPDSPVAAHYRARFDHILVDEYQDTSRLQAELFRAVARQTPANRFLVGDVKQSIYAFRRADPAGFVGVSEQLRSDPRRGRVFPLTDSFRTHADLLAPINRLFAALFHARFGGIDYDEAHHLISGLTPLANPTLGAGPRFAITIVPERKPAHDAGDDADDFADLERIEREARHVAARIQALLAAGAPVRDRDQRGEPCLRPLRPADVAILLRSARVQAGQVAAMLRAAGIAAIAGGGEHLLNSLEVRDVLAALQLTLNRRDDISLAAYLRGPFVGLNEPDLLTIRRAQPDHAFADAALAFAAATNSSDVAAQLRAALRQLDQWRVAARTCSAADLIRAIRRGPGGDLFSLARPYGATRLAALEALSDFADAQPDADVSEFLARLNALDESGKLKVTPASQSAEAVQVLTIHAAKGLEWPLVFLLGAGAAFDRRLQPSELRLDELLGAALNTADAPSRARWRHPQAESIRRKQDHAAREEELRIFYVAATRARERLEIVGHGAADDWRSAATAEPGAAHAARVHPFLVESAASVLEWCRLAHGAGAFASPIRAEITVVDERSPSLGETAPSSVDTHAQPVAASLPQVERDAARRWSDIETSEALTITPRPAALSVSALKSRSAVRASNESSAPASHTATSQLSRSTDFFARPTFMSRDPAVHSRDGRITGTIHHRFLRLCDLRRIASPADIQDQLATLQRLERLSPEEARLIDPEAIAWLGRSATGRLLAELAPHAQRELPFAFAIPAGNRAADTPTLLRGVIDCLIQTESGLTLIDYKTDRFRSDADRASRVGAYSAQLQLYGAAAAAIRGLAIQKTVLAFLHERIEIDVPPTDPDWASLIAPPTALSPA